MGTLRIAIIGPESSGKTELAKALEKVFPDTLATEEFARLYFAERKLPADHALTSEEMHAVMAGQLRLEQTVASQVAWIDASTVHGPLYFSMRRNGQGGLTFDFAKGEPELLDYARQAGYDAFILCWPHAELAWQDDGMRAMPEMADRVCFAKACQDFVQAHFPAVPVIHVDAATWDGRLQQAVTALKSVMDG